MNDNMTAFAAAWSRLLSAERTGDNGPLMSARDAIRLDDTPAYPLARTVAMPSAFSYETGSLSFRMTDLDLSGMSCLDGERCTQECEADRVRMKLLLARIILRGRYSLDVKPDPIIELDTAGDLMDLSPEALQPAGAGSQDGTLDPQQEGWLNQARDQRTRLSQTPNGQKLLEVHSEHNETYDTVFRTNKALTPLWRAGGATKEMAADTSDAIKNDTIINSAQKTYTGGVTYNGNAFVQQLNVASACVWTDPDFDPQTGPPPDSKYWAAAKAALSFGKGVSSTTNNTRNSTQEMKPSEVHATVEQHSADLPQITDDEMQQVVSMGISPAGADTQGLADWIIIDEEDRKRLRSLYEATMKQKAEDAAIIGQPLFAGRCEASIDAVEATVDLTIEDGPQGHRARAISAHVDLPAFGLDIDDSAWSGEAGTIARQRLEQMYFIRSLLHDAIVDRLQQALLTAVEEAYNTAQNLAS